MTAPELRAFLDAAFPNSSGSFRIDEVTEVGVRMHLPASAVTIRPGGTVSGPTLMTMADTAAWMALISRIGPEALSVTSNLTISFLRKPEADDVRAEAELLKLGKRLAVIDVRMRSGDRPAIVAQATVTYAIPSQRTAGGPPGGPAGGEAET